VRLYTSKCKTGVILNLVGMDYEGYLYPIAFGHFESESTECWTAFLEFVVASLPEYEPLLRARSPRQPTPASKATSSSGSGSEDDESITDDDDEEYSPDTSTLAFVADLGKGFMAAVSAVLPGAYVSHCVQHRSVIHFRVR
jgi:hypothetical protein